jgi:hypothetical protein
MQACQYGSEPFIIACHPAEAADDYPSPRQQGESSFRFDMLGDQQIDAMLLGLSGRTVTGSALIATDNLKRIASHLLDCLRQLRQRILSMRACRELPIHSQNRSRLYVATENCIFRQHHFEYSTLIYFTLYLDAPAVLLHDSIG